jgi:hypothetical protein
MNVKFVSLPTLGELRSYVVEMLCARDRLDPQQTALEGSLIRQSGKACGILFQVRGPRCLKTYAIWSSAENRILFYDSTGLRFAEVRLCEGPDIREVA